MDTEKAMNGLSNFIGSLPEAMSGEHRKEAMNIEIDGVVIDTVCPTDTRKWETGIEDNGKPWVIVEQYKDMKEATIGHNKWCQLVKEGKRDFKDINMWGLEDDDEGED